MRNGGFENGTREIGGLYFMKMYSKDGIEMMDIKKLWKEGNSIVMKGKIMQSMTMSIYMKPVDAWELKALLTWKLLLYLPIFVLKGWWKSRKNNKEKK